jgi:hypothetical protein
MLLSTRDAISRASTRLGKFLRPGGRLTLDASRAVTYDDITSATTIYYLAQDDGVVWLPVFNATSGLVNFAPYEFSSLTIPLGTLANSTNYDIFLYDANGVLTAKIGPAWASGTSRGAGAGTTELGGQRGVWLNAYNIAGGPAANCGLYVGSFRTISTTQTCDSGGMAGTDLVGARRFLWNQYNRDLAPLSVLSHSNGYSYNSTTWRLVAGQSFPSGCHEVLSGQPDTWIDLRLETVCYLESSPNPMWVGIGRNTLTAPLANTANIAAYNASASGIYTPASTQHRALAPLGYTFYAWLESAQATGTCLYVHQDPGQPLPSGMTGWWWR